MTQIHLRFNLDRPDFSLAVNVHLPGSGATAFDMSSASRHGTLGGSTGWTTPGRARAARLRGHMSTTGTSSR